MSLGEIIVFTDGSYEIRAIVDGRYVVRIRNRKRNTETYEVWTSDQREEFDRKEAEHRVQEDRRLDRDNRNRQMYERSLAGETFANLATEFGITSGRVRQICVRQARKERLATRPDAPSASSIAQDRLSTMSEEWEQAKPSSNPVSLSQLR